MRKDIKSQVDKLPDAPGVYLFKQAKQILYVGKATSLKSRVKSYFVADLDKKRSTWIAKMIPLVTAVEYQLTDSVLEALVLEAELIKKHQPPYNSREKDDKSFNYVVITKEDYPRVLTVRGKNLGGPRNWELGTLFGPFPHGGELREALKILRRIFPFRTTCQPESGKLCFDAQIGLCSGICGQGDITTKKEYRKLISQLKLFFRGKKKLLLKQLEREMKSAVKALLFEQAGQIKKRLFALQHIHDVSLLKRRDVEIGEVEPRFEAYDIAHLSGTSSVGVMVVALGHNLSKDQYRKFKLRGSASTKSNDVANLIEVLNRRLNHPEWPLPTAVVVDGGTAQLNAAQKILRERKVTINVIGIIKDERHRPKRIVGPQDLIEPYKNILLTLNAEAHRFAVSYHRKLRGRIA